MSETYELTRRIVSRGTFKTLSTERFRRSGGEPIYWGETRIGYLTAEVPFAAVENHPAVTFGPNRSFAPNAHCLKSGDGALIARIRHGLVQSMFGSREFTATDANGAALFRLVPGKRLKAGSRRPLGARLRGELYAVRGEEILGHTGRAEDAADSAGAITDATRRIGRFLSKLPGVLGARFREEVMGEDVVPEDEVVARFTLLSGAALEPHLIFAILMFKVHYHDMRGS